uniref:Uncharacterized protein n=1 Tax=Caenorhabditis japonica TaxID=281687 RepID=A0A8R1J1C5_CAEJA
MDGRLNKTVGDEKPAKHDGNEGLVDHRFSFADCEELKKADTISPMTKTSGCQTDSSPPLYCNSCKAPPKKESKGRGRISTALSER